ncbi:hypothetical protein C662_16058 [Thauera sp. 28]|uniref:hypothetical protein n=1 Tax=Thauera sp. 28 TaxID=303682 RepID=UPI0002CF3B73|nr:hypothetical protein [Thauera sp. 28]ENO91598.1 hypothetical protein C662_16058 [Thauera sp. 28]
MKHPNTDPLAALKNVDWLISNGGEISLGAVGPVESAAVASDESDCLAMLQRRDGESLYQLLTRLDAAIARAWDEGEFTDEINPNR